MKYNGAQIIAKQTKNKNKAKESKGRKAKGSGKQRGQPLKSEKIVDS